MLNLFVYEDVRRLQAERVARALARYRERHPIPLSGAATSTQGQVIEVQFRRTSRPERIGA